MIRVAAEMAAAASIVAGVYLLAGLAYALILAGVLFLLWSFLVG